MISRFFINRPIFASVISIVIVLAGIAAIKVLPISQYPEILPTNITVSATYLGASPETIANTVAAPLEQQINGVENMLYITSSSSNSGQLSITVYFALGTDPAQAEIDVSNRVQAALASLPDVVRQAGVNVNRKSSNILQIVTLSSPNDTYDNLFISNYALLNVIDALKRVPGVGDASLFGAANYSMRIWLKQDKMLYHNVTADDIENVINEQNSEFAIGKFAAEPVENKDFTYTIITNGKFSKIEEFENIIIRADNNGSALKLKDVARIELGAQNYDFVSKLDGKPSITIGVYLQTGSNALDTTDRVEKKMEELSGAFPNDLKYNIPFDTTKFVRVSIQEVVKTFIEAIALVVIVIFIFLQNLRATLIPLIAIPVSLIGTFAGMYLLGFSINLLTLFGLVLAIGIVVDDAIIVIENVERIMRQYSLSAHDASIKAMEEVSGPIIAIVLILCSVFLPIAFIGGLSGVIYKQFAVTIVISVILSGIVALTLTPALCAQFLEYKHQTNRGFISFNNWFDRLTNSYSSAVAFIMNHAITAVIVFLLLVTATIILFMKLPTSLVPEEDQGYIITVQALMPASSLDRTVKVVDKFTEQVIKDPAVNNVISLAGLDLLGGGSKTNVAAAFIRLKDWSLRKKDSDSAQNLAGKFMGIGSQVTNDGIILAFNPPPIIGMSTTGGWEAYIQYHGNDSDTTSKIDEITNKFLAEARKNVKLAGVRTTFSATSPIYSLELDRIKAKAFKVNIQDLYNSLNANFGTIYVNDFLLYGRTYRVYMQSDIDFRSGPENLRDIFVKSSDDHMIPISTFVKIKKTVGPDNFSRFNIFPAAQIAGNSAPGYSSGEAIKEVEAIASKVLPNDFSIGWTGSAYQEKAASDSGIIAFVAGIIMVFLILAALYERWSLPFAVITIVPFAVFGALIAQYMRGLSNDVYFQVGLITLIGLSAKNAILIVEFAFAEYKKGVSAGMAAIQAIKLRFRPIIMTSLAFILGCVPLYFSTGAGAASRHSIGTGIIGGMLAVTFIATYFIPLFFKLIVGLGKPPVNHITMDGKNDE